MSDRNVVGRLVSNSRWNVISFAVSLVANFLTIPLAIAAIGLDAFGAAGLVLAVLAPCSLVGTVLGQGLVKELSPRLALGDSEASRRALWTALQHTAVGVLVVLVLAWCIGRGVLEGMSRSGGPRDWTLPLWLGMGAWVAQQICLILQATLSAVQAYGRLAMASAAGAVLSAILVVGASRWWPGESGFLLGTAAGFTVTAVLLLVALARGHGWLLRPLGRDRALSGRLLHFARWQGSGHLAGQVANQVDRYMLAAVAPLALVGQYNVAMRLQEVVHMGLLKVTEVLYPHFSVTSDQPLAKRADFYARACWVLNLLGVAALAPLIPLSDALITLWVDAAAAEGGGPLLRTLATAGAIGCGVNVFSFMAMASDRVDRLAQLNVAHSAIVIALTVPLIGWVGPLTAGVAYVVGNVFRLAAAGWLGWSHYDGAASPSTVLASGAVPIAGGLLASWLLWFSGAVQVSSWPMLALAYAGAGAVVLAGAALSSLALAGGRCLAREVWSAGRSLAGHPRSEMR